MAGKPRIMLGPKDLIWSLIPLVLISLVVAAVAAQCTLSPGGPTAGPTPTFDAKSALRADAQALPFPIRDPQVPAGWQSNSGRHAKVAGGKDVTVIGYLTDGGRFLELAQSDGSAEELVAFADSELRREGTKRVGGQVWTIYAMPSREPAWVADVGGARVLITGAGNEAEYLQFAAAVDAAPVLTR